MALALAHDLNCVLFEDTLRDLLVDNRNLVAASKSTSANLYKPLFLSDYTKGHGDNLKSPFKPRRRLQILISIHFDGDKAITYRPRVFDIWSRCSKHIVLNPCLYSFVFPRILSQSITK